MYFIKILFLFLGLCISSTVSAQIDEKDHVNNLFFSCTDCDSLYNLVCSPRDTLIYGEDVDVMPQFPGGESVLIRFIRENTQYPKVYANINFQGLVVINFIINEKGEVICPRVILSLYPEFDAEAIRVIQLLPKWIPARKDYRPTNFCYTVPVVFTSYGAERNRDFQWKFNVRE